MLSFVHDWFGPKCQPIGVDFGSDCLRLAQVQCIGPREHRLVAAASCDVPAALRDDPDRRLGFLATALRDLLSHGGFRGRSAVLGLPSAMTDTLTFQAGADQPAPDAAAIRRQLGLTQDQILVHRRSHELAGGKRQWSATFAPRDWVGRYARTAEAAKLAVVGISTETEATGDCLANVFRRRSDSESASLLLDIGYRATRVMITRLNTLLATRQIPVGGRSFTQLVARATGLGFEDARLLRIRHAVAPTRQVALTTGRAGDLVQPGEELPAIWFGPTPEQVRWQAEQIETACAGALNRIYFELGECIGDYNTSHPEHPVRRILFLGGEARQLSLCRRIALSLQLAGQIADPLVRMARHSLVGLESGIDRRIPQPTWTVAVGLSMGPPGDVADRAPRRDRKLDLLETT